MDLNQIIERIGVEPYYREDAGVIYNADCLDILPKMPEGCVDLVLTDPPYGIGKASWDSKVPVGYIPECLRTAKISCIMPGLWALPICLAGLGESYKSIIAGHNKNGMTYSPIGFGNWIPAVVAGDKIPAGQDAFDFIIDEGKPPHPSPKPLRYIRWLINRLSEETDLVCDPFLGSGTTAVAAKQLGRKYIGIEIEKKYCDIAVQRLAQEILI